MPMQMGFRWYGEGNDKIRLSDIKVGKINIDEQPELAGRFGVMSIPTLVVMKEGKIVNLSVGAKPKHAILAML